MFEREDTPLRRWRRSVKKIGLLAVLAGLAPALSADSHSPAELPDKPAAAVAVSAESALSALSDGFLYSDYLQNLPNLQTETTPIVSGFHGSFAVENRPSLLESIADGLPARLRQEAQSVPLRQWGLGWAIDSRRPEVTPALAAGGWRLADWLGKEVLLAATDKYGIQTLEFDLQSELGGRRAAIGVNALGALRQTERNAIAWQLSGFKSKDGVGGNVGGLYRWVTPDENHLLGANVFLDYEDYEAGAFNRWSLGGEWRSAWVDAFANVYRGITDSKLHKGERYYTADGYELEVNVHSPNVAWIAGALTYYNWKGENGDSDEDGVRFGLKFTPTLPLLLEVEYDDGDDRDNDWGGRIVYSGEFGGVQSPSVHRRGGEFIPRDFFFIAANRESTQRIRKVENNLPSPRPGRVINLGQRGAAGAAHNDIVIHGTDITLTLGYMDAAPAHYIKGGLEFGVSVAASVTVSLAAKYTVQSAAELVTVQSNQPFAVETGAGTQIRTLFVGSTVALATNYVHLINGRVSLSSGGESYEVRRNIRNTLTLAATYDSFIVTPAAILTVISPVPNFKDPITLSNPEGVRVQRFSDDPAAIPPSSGQINLADQLFDSPAVNGRRLSPTGSSGVYNATHRLYAQASQPLTATIRLSVLSGYRAKTEPTSGQTLTLIGDATFTLTIADPQDTQTQIFNIERDTDLGLPVPVHSNTLNLELAYSSITPLTNPTFAKIPSDTVLRTFTSLTASAVPIAVLTVSGGREDNYQYRLIAGDNFEIVGDTTLQLTAPGYGLYTATVEFANDLSGVPADAAAAFREISPPVMATHTVQVTNIYDRIGGTWNIVGHPNLDDDATVTIQRVAAAAVIVGTLIASGGDGTYTYTLHGGDAAKASIDGNGVLSLPDSTALPGDIDLTVEINDTSDHTDTTQPQNQQTAPITITLLIRYMKVDALAAAVETPSGVSGTVLAAAAVPGAATPAASVNVSGGDGNATVRLAAGGDASFAVDSANRIVWTPRAFGKATATLAVSDGLTGLPGGTDEQNPVVVAELIRAASLSFDGGHLTPDSGIASLTVTLYFDEEIPQAERSFATLMIANGYDELGAPVFDASGDEFYALHNDGRLEIKMSTKAEVSPKTGIIRINYRQTDNSKPTLINPNGHRYAVRLESAYRPITLQAFTPDGQTEIAAPVRVLTNNATVASLVATGGRAGRDLQVLAGADNFELFESDTKLRLKVADGATTPSAFRLYTVTLRYADNSGNSEELILTVDYVEETPPLALSFAGGIGNGGNVVLHRTAAGSVRIATLNIGGGLPPFVVGEKSASSDYDLANAPNTSRSRILYIPAGVEPTTGQGKEFAAEITVSDADDDASPAQSITLNVRYVKVNELASSLTDASGTPGTPLGTVYVFSESVLSTLRTKLTEMKTTGGSAVERDFLVLEAHKDGREIISDRDRDYEIGHTANAADADLYFTPRDGYGTYSVVFKMRDSSVFGDGMIARAGFSPPTKQTLTVHARPIIVSVFAGHRPDRSNHASTVGLTHLPLQNTVIQLTVTARHDLVLTRAVLASNFITVAQINAPPGITYHGFADYLQRLIPPNADHPPDGGRINIVRLGPQSGQPPNPPISPTGQTFTLIMTARIGNNVGPEVATVRMEVKFEQELALDFVAPDSTDGTGDPKTLWRGVRFHPTAPVVVASAVLGGGTNPALSALPSDSDFQLLADNKIGLLPDRFGTYSLTVRATEDGGLTAETALTITMQPLYEVYVGDQKIEDPGGNIRFTVSVAAEPITSPVRVAQFRFLGEGAANHCAGFSSGNAHLLALQTDGAICHMVVVPQSSPVTPDNRVLDSYINVGSSHLHPGLNRLALDRNIEVQLAPKSGIRLTDPAAPASDPRTVFVDTEIKSNDNLEIAKVVAVVESGSPQIALINTDTNNPFSIDNANLLRLSPTRFGAHTATVRATDSANNSTADAIVTVSVHRAFRVFPGGGDTELTYQAADSSDYRFSVSITFDQTVVANLTLAELRGFNADVCTRSTSPLFSNSASKAPGGVDIVKNGASCHLVLKPSPSGQDPTLPDNRDLVFDWAFSNPGSGYRFLSAGGVGARIFVKLAPKPDIKLSDPDLGGGDGIPRLHYAIGRFNRAVDLSPGGIVEPRSRLRIARMRAGPGAGSIYNTIGSSTKFSFDVDDESRLLLTPGTSRFSAGPGTHIVTVAIGTSLGQATRTITVQLDRLYQIYDTDGDVLPDDLYQITLAIPFADEISANRDVAEFRLSGTGAALHCAGATAENADTSAAKDNIEFEFMKNAANCKLVFRPGSGKPNIRAAGQTLTVNVDFPDGERYYGTANPAYRIILDAMYEPIQLALGGANGSGLPITVVTSRDAEFARVGATGGDGTYTYEKIGGGTQITVAADGDLHFNVAANAYGEQTITVKVTDGAGEVDPATLIVKANYIDRPYTMTDYRGNDIAPVIVNDIHEIRVSVYGPDRATWDAGATDFAFVTLRLASGATKGNDSCAGFNFVIPADDCEGNIEFLAAGGGKLDRWQPVGDTKLEAAPGHEEGILFQVLVNSSAVATVWIRGYFIRTTDLALAVEKPESSASGPVRWFTEFASPPVASLVASLDATGGGEGTRAVITAAPPGDIFALSNENILSFKPTAKGIYTLTLAAMDNVGTTPATETVTVAYGDPLVAQMNSGGHDDSVQNGTLSNGGTVIFHNYFASAGRTGTTDLPIATLVASGGVGARTFTWQDTSTGTPGNDSGYVVVSNGILWLNRFHDDSSGNPVNSPGTGRAIESTPEFAATITVDDGFDASPPVLLSITGAAFQHRRPANKPDPENPRIQLETGGNVFALHTDTGETPILTLGLPSTAAIDTTNGFVVATVRVGGGYDSKRFSRVDGSSSSDMDVRNPSNDGDDELREVILRNNVTNLADFPADANGESNTRSVVITYKTRYLGRDFFDASIQEPHEATISLKFKIKKMTATRESKDLIAAANAAIPATLVSGNPIGEAADNSGDIAIHRTDNTLTYAGLTVAKMTYKNLVGLGGKIPLSDLLVANANSILTVTAGSAEGEFFVKTRVPAAHAASNPFTPAIGGANIDGGFVANATRYATPTPFSVEIFVAPAFGGGTRNVKIPAPYEIPGGAVGFRAVAAGGGAGGTNLQMRFDWGYSAGNQVFEPNGAHANRKIFDLNTGGGGNPRARFFVHDTNPAGLPSGVDFTPERQIDIAFTRRGSATDISCQNGGTGGITQLFTEPGNVVVGRNISGDGDYRLNLRNGLIAQSAVAYRKALNIYIRAASPGAGVGSRYNQCKINGEETNAALGRRTHLLCKIHQPTSSFTNPELAVQAGDVVMVAPGPPQPNNFGEFPAHFDVMGYIRNARKAQGGRSAVHYNAERHSNIFRVYHKPGVVKTTKSDQLELFLARGELDDFNDGCQGVDLPDDGSEGFYLNSRFIRTYKWRDAATKAELDARVVITSNTGRPQATDPSTFSCREGGNIGGNTQIYTGASGPVGGGFATRTDLHLGLTSQAGAAFQRILNIFISHTATSAGGTHRYSRCRIFGNSRQHIVCNLTFPHHGQANPMSPVYAGDIVLVAPTAKAGFNVIHNGIRYDTTGTGKFDNVLNLIAQRDQSAADERNMNLFRVYSRPGVQRPGDSNQLELFLARGVEGGHEGDYAPTCAAEDLPDGGNRFYLTSAGVRTYKASEAAPESAFRDRVPNGQRPRPAP